MSITGHRGLLPLLNVSEENVRRWRQHRQTSKAYEVLLGHPAPFEDLAFVDNALPES
jgi:hypothetical protein